MSSGGHWDTGPEGVEPPDNALSHRHTPDCVRQGADRLCCVGIYGPDTHVCDPDIGERCQGGESATEIRTQDELLTDLDELLDNALHDDHCYITPNDTVCVCVIGRLRAVLPPCGAVQIRKVATQGAFGGEGRSVWKCLRNAHPASPDRHYFGED